MRLSDQSVKVATKQQGLWVL